MRNRRACLLVLLGLTLAWAAWIVFPKIGDSFRGYRDEWAERMGIRKGMSSEMVIDHLGQPDTVLFPERPPVPGEYPGLDAPISGQVFVYRSFGLLGRAYIYLNQRGHVRAWGGGPG